jgi:hypothetical protein
VLCRCRCQVTVHPPTSGYDSCSLVQGRVSKSAPSHLQINKINKINKGGVLYSATSPKHNQCTGYKEYGRNI